MAAVTIGTETNFEAAYEPSSAQVVVYGIDAGLLVSGEEAFFKVHHVPFTRTDASCGTTSGSDSVTDASIVAGDYGSAVIGPGIPAGTYVGTVTAGVSFLLSSTSGSQTNVNATATGTVSLQIGPERLWLSGTYIGGNDVTPDIIFDPLPVNTWIRATVTQQNGTGRAFNWTRSHLDRRDMPASPHGEKVMALVKDHVIVNVCVVDESSPGHDDWMKAMQATHDEVVEVETLPVADSHARFDHPWIGWKRPGPGEGFAWTDEQADQPGG